MKHLDLFSGIGGFAYAAKAVWGNEYKCVGFVENNKFCQEILKKRFPRVKIYEDIRNFGVEKIEEKCDLLTGGFPCQPFSVAGKRKGKEDDRYLWPEMLRIIKELRPAWVFGENVVGIVRMALDQVLADLESEGYATRAFIIPACAVNAPHRRDRVWIIGYNSLLGKRKLPIQSRQSRKTNIDTFRADCDDPNSYKAGFQVRKRQKSNRAWKNCRAVTIGSDASPWNENWIETATRFCRVDDGIPAELDFIGGINEYWSNKKKRSEIDSLIWKAMRVMWEYTQTSETSQDIYYRKLQDCVSEMPYDYSHGKWNLGQRFKEDEELCRMWQEFYALPFKESYQLQQRVLECFGKIKRKKKMEKKYRTDRLKCLGNAIVPQVAMKIFKAIQAVEKEINE